MSFTLCTDHRGVCQQRCSHLQVYDSRGAVTLHRIELQVSLKVLGIQTGDGQAISKTSLKEKVKKFQVKISLTEPVTEILHSKCLVDIVEGLPHLPLWLEGNLTTCY